MLLIVSSTPCKVRGRPFVSVLGLNKVLILLIERERRVSIMMITITIMMRMIITMFLLIMMVIPTVVKPSYHYF